MFRRAVAKHVDKYDLCTNLIDVTAMIANMKKHKSQDNKKVKKQSNLFTTYTELC